ncbi:MAG TPA: NHL repeat-containing protein [Candidatus Sulfotelmatobacter sp.]|nr:NHL repeat-containing protein [Candidatus Sulfotelmatobacter sp.]
MGRRASVAGATLVFCSLVYVGAHSYQGMRAESEKPPAAALEFLGAWGIRGDGPGELQDPVSIATDTLGNIYIADAATRFVHKFSPQGTPLLTFQEDPLKHPQSITVDTGGAIYVTDPVRESVFVCFPGDKDRYRELKLKLRASKENLLSVAVAADGLIFVLDSDAGKLFTFSSRLRLQQSWNPPMNASGPRNHPSAVAIGPDYSLYIADPTDGRILRFTTERQFVSEFTAGTGSMGGKLSDEFAVSKNFLFVMDVDGRMLHVRTPDGQSKLDVDLAPELGQAPRRPPPIAASPRGELLVLDESAARVLRYRINF